MSDEESEWSWWKSLGLAALCFLLAVLVFWYLGDLEESNRAGRIHWFLALLYYVGGKWTASGFLALIGLILAYLGIRQLRDQYRSDD